MAAQSPFPAGTVGLAVTLAVTSTGCCALAAVLQEREPGRHSAAHLAGARSMMALAVIIGVAVLGEPPPLAPSRVALGAAGMVITATGIGRLTLRARHIPGIGAPPAQRIRAAGEAPAGGGSADVVR